MQNTDEKNASLHDILSSVRTDSDPEIRSRAFGQLSEIYRPLLSSYVKRFSQSPFADLSELEQEASIALYRAALTYEEDRHTTFGLYAGICIRNRLISCLRRESRMYGTGDAVSGAIQAELRYPTAVDGGSDPGEQLAFRDMFRETFDRFLVSLTAMEKRVFTPYIRGASYKEIARILSISEKSVDNAVYRIRVKLRRALDGE